MYVCMYVPMRNRDEVENDKGLRSKVEVEGEGCGGSKGGLTHTTPIHMHTYRAYTRAIEAENTSK